MEKLEEIIKSFRISRTTKTTLIKMASIEEIELQQMCRKILNKAAREFNSQTLSESRTVDDSKK